MSIRKHRNRQPSGAPVGGQFAAESGFSTGLTLPVNNAIDPLEANRMDVSPETLVAMLDHSQPSDVRAAAARRGTVLPGLGELAASDPDPYVRSLALVSWDLSDRTRAELEADPEVQRTLAILSGKELSANSAPVG